MLVTYERRAGIRRLSVHDYGDLERLPKEENVEVLVRSSGFTYRFENGRWIYVGRAHPRSDAGYVGL